jgi:hypothetical protein
MRKLENTLDQLLTYSKHAAESNPQISMVPVGWHIEHSLMVILKIVETVCQSDPSNYHWKFNWIRTLVFLKKTFPRGKAKAPDAVKPQPSSTQNLEDLATQAKAAIIKLSKAGKNQFFKHPYFGNLNRRGTFTMLYLHTKHHLHIIQDIVNMQA